MRVFVFLVAILCLPFFLMIANPYLFNQVLAAGGGDPYGCYVSEEANLSERCRGVIEETASRLRRLQSNGYYCRMEDRNWVCRGNNVILIPHEGRFR